jgi:hypothetical protein
MWRILTESTNEPDSRRSCTDARPRPRPRRSAQQPRPRSAPSSRPPCPRVSRRFPRVTQSSPLRPASRPTVSRSIRGSRSPGCREAAVPCGPRPASSRVSRCWSRSRSLLLPRRSPTRWASSSIRRRLRTPPRPPRTRTCRGQGWMSTCRRCASWPNRPTASWSWRTGRSTPTSAWRSWSAGEAAARASTRPTSASPGCTAERCSRRAAGATRGDRSGPP